MDRYLIYNMLGSLHHANIVMYSDKDKRERARLSVGWLVAWFLLFGSGAVRVALTTPPLRAALLDAYCTRA